MRYLAVIHRREIVRALLLAVCFSAPAASLCFSQDKPTSLAEARAAVEANLRTSEGKAYDEQIGKEFQQKYLAALRECKESSGGDLTSFWILMKLDEAGAVKEVLLSPTTKLGSCAREALRKGTFSAPSKPGHWVSIYLQLSHQ
jgi:hypothetical protein